MKTHFRTGFTLIEIMVVLGLTSLLMSLFAPTYRGIQKSWEQSSAMSEVRQGGLVGTDFINKQLRQAQKITAISDADDANGSISFEMPSGETQHFVRYTYNGQPALGWQVGGTLSPIAVPIDALYFTAFDKDGNPTTSPALIQSVAVSMQLADTTGQLATQTFNTQIKIRKDIVTALHYTSFASGNITLSGSGSIEGNVHANGSVSLTTVTLSGTATSGTHEPLPDPNLARYQQDILPVASYRTHATTVITGNYTFQQNNTYNGIYYIVAGNGIIEKNVNINGAVYAEGNLIIDGQNVTVIGPSTLPALVAGHDIIVSDFQDFHFRVTGTAYAHRDITLPGKDAIMTAGTVSPIAMGAGRDFHFSGFDFTTYGLLLAGRNMTFTSYNKRVSISANTPNPAILAGGTLNFHSRDTLISGLVYSAGNITVNSDDFDLTGTLVSAGHITGSKPVRMVYMNTLLNTPPPYMAEGSL